MPDDWTRDSSPYLSPREPGQRDAWTDEAAQRGHKGTQVLRDVASTVPPAPVALALRLHDGATAVVRRRQILLDGQVVQLVDSWYPSSVAEGTALAEPRKIPGGAVTLLAKIGLTSHHVDERRHTRPATADERDALGLTTDAVVDVMMRVCGTSADAPYEVTIEVAPAATSRDEG